MRRPLARLMVPAGRGNFAGHGAQDGRLAAAVRANQAELHAVRDAEADAANDLAAAQRDADIFKLDQALGLAIGGGELDASRRGTRARVDIGELADEFVRVVDARLGLGGTRLRSAAQPLDLGLHAVAQALLHLALRLHVELAALEKLRVGSAHAQHALGVDAAQLDNLAGNVLEKVAIMRDHDAGKPRAAEHAFEPLNAFEIEMIGRLVEQQHIGLGDHGLGDGQPLAPAAREACGFGIHADGGVGPIVGKAGAAQGLAQPLLALVGGNAGALERSLHHAAHGQAQRHTPRSAARSQCARGGARRPRRRRARLRPRARPAAWTCRRRSAQ